MDTAGLLDTAYGLRDRYTALLDANLSCLDDEEAEELARTLEEVARIAAAVGQTSIADLAARKLPERRVCTSAATYLRGLLRISIHDARCRLRTVDWLQPRVTPTGEPVPPRYPTLARAQRDGAVSTEHVCSIAGRLDSLPAAVTDDVRREAERVLTDRARAWDPGLTHVLSTRLEDVLNPDGVLTTEREAKAATSLTLTRGHQGRWVLHGEFDSAAADLIRTALDPLSAPAPGPDGTRDPRSPSRRRAEGFLQILSWHLDHPHVPGHGGRPPQLVLTTTLDDLRRGGGFSRTAWGTLLPAAVTDQVACDADLTLAVLDEGGAVLNHGRSRRLISAAQREALNLRDKGCVFDGCDRPPAWCRGHHVVRWIDGGPTDLPNTCLLCDRHHAEIHSGSGWEIAMIDGRAWTVPPAWVDPDRVPRFNAVHDPPLLVPA